jgi:hypothetical protein
MSHMARFPQITGVDVHGGNHFMSEIATGRVRCPSR